MVTDKFEFAAGYNGAEEKLAELMKQGDIITNINDKGRVTIVKAFHEEYSTDIEVWGTMYDPDGT
jgi:hypothetical protein